LDHRQILVATVTRRNPIRCGSLPTLAVLYRRALEGGPSSQMGRFCYGFAVRRLLGLRQRLPWRSEGTFFLRSGNEEKTVRYDARNTQFCAIYLTANAGGYEPDLTTLLDLFLPPGGTFYDIGSNWGYVALFAATQPNFCGQVHAFEPFAPSFADLTQIVQEAGLNARIQCHQVALSDQDGVAAMRRVGVHSGTATMEAVGPDRHPAAIRMATLDSLGLPDPDFIKIDAEGAEEKILRGARRLLDRRRPMIVFESWRNFHDRAQTLGSLQLLSEAGYVFFQPCWMRKEGGQRYFTPAEPGAPGVAASFALVPLTLEDRFLYQDLMNILAVHREELAPLTRVFQAEPAPG
jgi:FkbM family methyltransferase